LCTRAERLFREARFDEAAAAWQAALERNPSAARAHWGLGRIDLLHSRRLRARDHFAAAYQLNWRDPAIVLAYADFVSDVRLRDLLLRNVAALARNDVRDGVRDAWARLEIDRRMGAKHLSVIASPYKAYRLRLEPWVPDGIRERGLLIHARIEGGRLVRLLLDTAAHGITLTGRGAGLEPIAQAKFAGFGAGFAVDAHVAIAKRVAFDDLLVENCIVNVAETAIAPGVSGVIGTDTFQQFLLRLDARSRSLELLPFADRPNPPAGLGDLWIGEDAAPCTDCSGLQETVRIGDLLLVKGPMLRAADSSYSLLDPGSSYDGIPMERLSNQGGSRGGVVGIHGALDAAALPAGNSTLIGLDFTSISDEQGVQISGIIGYPTIRKLILAIDYRDGAVRFLPHTR